MRKRKLYIFLVSLACLFLIYKFVLPQTTLFPLAFSSPQVICNSSSLSEKSKTTPWTTTLQSDKLCYLGDLVYGNYCVISPYTEDSLMIGEPFATLSTQGTVEFLHHLTVLCRRWSGPISVAVYSPPNDYLDARKLVDTLRDCDFCIRHWVSWHFFYYNTVMPDYVDSEGLKSCIYVAQERRPKKRKSQGTYPINVGRNIARMKTITPFVFPIDIELYPSVGLLPKFERMIRNTDISNGLHVWVLPVFEVQSKSKVPETKSELRTMYIKKQAISFHQYRCDLCHRIPNLTQWLNHDINPKSEINESLESLQTWITVKRSKKYRLQYWEPFFFGTKEDPEFDIRLSWEGKQNKMQIAYEMCLMDYNFHIVDNAFLVHAPGINVYNASKEKFKEKYILENNKWIKTIRKDLVKKYGPNQDC